VQIYLVMFVLNKIKNEIVLQAMLTTNVLSIHHNIPSMIYID